MASPFFTVGHSDRALDEFTALLRDAGIQLVVDVRKLPGSRSNPQFDRDALGGSLPRAGIGYRHATDLGGRRPVAKDVPFEVNGLWRSRSFHNYADYALTDGFRAALARLRSWGTDERIAVMCSEAVWWRCHRRIIADHLLAHGEQTFHLMAGRRVDAAQLTPGAVVRPDCTVVYPSAS